MSKNLCLFWYNDQDLDLVPSCSDDGSVFEDHLCWQHFEQRDQRYSDQLEDVKYVVL